MNLLIIGSNGFIGSNIIKFYKTKKNVGIFKCDVFQQKNIEKLDIIIEKRNPNFDNIFKEKQFDVCINASGAANVQFSFEQTEIDYKLNVSNVFKILDSIKKFNPLCKFINFSSAAVYGNPEILPIKETTVLNPLSPYGWHKMQSEQICKEFYSIYKIPTLSLRVFSAYGPGLKKQLFWDLFNKIQNATNNQLSLFGSGNESRDFIYIDDLLKAIALLIKKQDFNGETINVSSGQEITIREAAESFVNIINPNINLTFNNENKIGDPKNWRADISILKSIGFDCDFSLKEGLINYAKWLKELK